MGYSDSQRAYEQRMSLPSRLRASAELHSETRSLLLEAADEIDRLSPNTKIISIGEV